MFVAFHFSMHKTRYMGSCHRQATLIRISRNIQGGERRIRDELFMKELQINRIELANAGIVLQ